ncbi:hypothetical protein ACOMICROBIO_GDFFDHBD_01806 [Vibrio sp. B1REV9]|uniref:hypothetical protein n=1 Tax=Vibrio sp. B1REV9 TaxID=2751179 RepID=UPI001AFAE487|nr:hypothetical protein [Vibrio sp. B1REV9]CAE6917944.1 hypothetical protein ACOMICROBIO_GDFFDHBD_01806 [Vibrio sp. B1REV9]
MKEKLLTVINSGKKSDKELITLYQRVQKSSDKLSGEEVKELIWAIEFQLRDRFPRAANRIFGARDKEVIALLESVVRETTAHLNHNKVGSHVKTGGGRIRGDVYIQTYISYKNGLGQKAELCLEQQTFDSELVAIVYEQPSKSALRTQKIFNFGQFEQAKLAYITLLQQYSS